MTVQLANPSNPYCHKAFQLFILTKAYYYLIFQLFILTKVYSHLIFQLSLLASPYCHFIFCLLLLNPISIRLFTTLITCFHALPCHLYMTCFTTYYIYVTFTWHALLYIYYLTHVIATYRDIAYTIKEGNSHIA